MNKSLLFIPDISGFTEFVQTTEVNHSLHVIAELLEVLIDANTEGLLLAEVEGDALFFYKEEIPSLEKLLAQVETMYTAFYSHLKLLEKNRICPCNACSSAPKLQLKIIAHCGEIGFITVQDKRKPFGVEVIQAHRLLKNSVNNDQYVLLSNALNKEVGLSTIYQSKLFQFQQGIDAYDGKEVSYTYAVIEKENLKLRPFLQAKKINFKKEPSLVMSKEFPVSATVLLEYISNYAIRTEWVDDTVYFIYKKDEVTRLGTEHTCVINEKHLDFITITKEVGSDQLVYGELSKSIGLVDAVYQFFIITPLRSTTCRLDLEVYLETNSLWKKIVKMLVLKKNFQKNITTSINSLYKFVLIRI